MSKCWILRKIAEDLDWPWIINCSQIRPQLPKNFTKYFQKPSLSERFKGVFYPTLSFYTLDLWPCQLWSAIESCDVADLISKRNKLWKRFRDSLKIRNISNLYLHCTERPPQYWCYPPTVLMLSPHCTEGIPPLYWIPSTVLMLSPHCTDVIPRMYWCYPPNVLNTLHSTEAIPPLYWCYPPTVLNNLHSTEGISPQYWRYPPTCTAVIPPQYWRYPSTVLNTLHSTDVIPPQYWCYPPACTDVIPPLYWTTSTVLKISPHSTEAIPPLYWTTSTVLKLSPHSTEAIPPQYWSYPPTVLMLSPRCTEQPPMYWTTSTVLNRRYVGWFMCVINEVNDPSKEVKVRFMRKSGQYFLLSK